MIDQFGKPRDELIDLLTSTLGRMAAQRIDERGGYLALLLMPGIKHASTRMLKLIDQMNRDQLEVCHIELNEFFRLMPFSKAIPIAILIERKWPHFIETLPEANQRLDFVRQGGEYAVIFDTKKLQNLLICIEEQKIRADECLS